MDQLQQIAKNMSLLVSDAFVSIEAHTGLSPALFFVVLGFLLGSYYLISGVLAPAQIDALATSSTPRTGLNLGEVPISELAVYDGENGGKPLLMAVRGIIYDVSSSRDIYGPGGPFGAFAGKDASRALAKLRVDKRDLCGDLDGLDEDELALLGVWEQRILSKYPKVGMIGTPNKQAEAHHKDREAAKGEEQHAIAPKSSGDGKSETTFKADPKEEKQVESKVGETADDGKSKHERAPDESSNVSNISREDNGTERLTDQSATSAAI